MNAHQILELSMLQIMELMEMPSRNTPDKVYNRSTRI
jgi:hypothetical protein